MHDEVPLYGSGGFCSYSDEQLARQLAGWVDDGNPAREDEGRPRAGARPRRVRVARLAIGDEAELYVDANGAFNAEARRSRCAEAYAAWG